MKRVVQDVYGTTAHLMVSSIFVLSFGYLGDGWETEGEKSRAEREIEGGEHFFPSLELL